jgi:hypothetical protein
MTVPCACIIGQQVCSKGKKKRKKKVTVYRQILINAKLKTGRVDWENSIKETNVRMGLYCHLRRRGKRWRRRRRRIFSRPSSHHAFIPTRKNSASI